MGMSRMKKCGIAGITLFVFSFIHRYVILPPIVKMRTKQQVELRPGKFMRGLWAAYPFAFEFSVYMFNVTNPDEISSGAKPILKEVGPFVYDQWQEKANLVDYNDDDTVSYSNKYTHYFNAEKSNGLTGEEELVVPNYFILGLVNSLMIEKPSALPVVGKGVDSIFKKPSSIFMKAKVKDLLFDGFLINCTVKDFAGSAICTEVRGQYNDLGLKKIAEDVYLMSLFGASNGTSSKGKIRINRGSKKLKKVGLMTEFNDNNNISTWNDPICDAFHGTDGTIYRPFLVKTETNQIFAEPLCRTLTFNYAANNKYSGIKTWRYVTSVGVDPENNPEDKCYCMDPDKCLKKGVFDTYKCTKLPIIVSNPHFYLADPYYLTLVDGLHPDMEKHVLHVDHEPMSAVPMYANSRVQINMLLSKLEKFKLMKNMPEALFPLLWIENNLSLPKFLVKTVKQGLMLYKIAIICHYLMMLSGIGFSAYTGYLYMKTMKKKRKEMKKTVQPVTEIVNKAESVDKSMPLNVAKLQPAQVPPNID